MNVGLVTIAIICIVAAVVCGNLTFLGSNFPQLNRVVRVLLALVGLSTLMLGLFADRLTGSAPEARDGESSTANTRKPADQTTPSTQDNENWEIDATVCRSRS